MERRAHDRLTHPGRRRTDQRRPAADHRRVLLVGAAEGWRLLTAYLFEEAGYSAYAAADGPQALACTTRLLPDVVVIRMETLDALTVLMRLAEDASTSNIPVVVISSSRESADAGRVRAAGGVPFLQPPGDVDVLVGEVDTLIPVAARAQRALKRRLLDLQELARYYASDADGHASLRRLIDHLQVAVFAVDDEGQCVAASEGATRLTGYSRQQLLTASVLHAAFAGGRLTDDQGREVCTHRQSAGTTTITTQAGEEVRVHAATYEEILPGFHVRAFVAADRRLSSDQTARTAGIAT